MPQDELERLRAALARAYERPSFRMRLFEAMKSRLGARIKKKAISERVETPNKKDAA